MHRYTFAGVHHLVAEREMIHPEVIIEGRNVRVWPGH